MASFLSRVFRNRSLSRASSFRSSEPSLNDSSQRRAPTKLSSSASVGNLSSYTIDSKELERNKLHKAAWTGKFRKVQRLARPGQVDFRDSHSRVSETNGDSSRKFFFCLDTNSFGCCQRLCGYCTIFN